MMQLINQDHYGEFVEELADMHRLRYRVFKERLEWDVQVSGNLEGRPVRRPSIARQPG